MGKFSKRAYNVTRLRFVAREVFDSLKAVLDLWLKLEWAWTACLIPIVPIEKTIPRH